MAPLLAVLLTIPMGEPAYSHVVSDCVIGSLWCRQHGSRLYVPQEGDLVFLSRTAPLRTATYWLFRTGHPLHAGMIVRRANGSLAIFESGGGASTVTTLQQLGPRFNEQINYLGGNIWVRPISRPLAPHESLRLTRFAESQVGKALIPHRKYLRLFIPGRPAAQSHAAQDEWFCSELVVQALKEAGILRTTLSSASIVPADLFHDKRINLSARWSQPKEWMTRPVPMR